MKISAQRMAPKHGSDTRGCDVSKTIQKMCELVMDQFARTQNLWPGLGQKTL